MFVTAAVAGDAASVAPKTADAIIDENAQSRLNALQTSLAVLSLFALVALFFSRKLPSKQPT